MEEIGLRNWLKIYAKIGWANNISKFYRFVPGGQSTKGRNNEKACKH